MFVPLHLRCCLTVALVVPGVLAPAIEGAERPDVAAMQGIPLDVVRAGNQPRRTYHAIRLAGPAPAIDGRFDDPCWNQQGEWAGEFIQREPQEGQPATEPTEFKILYDHRNLYVAIRCFDADLDGVPFQRAKRDENAGDIVGIIFDSYYDRRTGFEFDVTSGGSQVDGLLLNDDFDTSWNAVYDVRVAKEANAWTAEFRIPFSQLRYANKPEQIWGLDVWRWIHRKNEESEWQIIPQDNPGTMTVFGHLHGISGLERPRQIEITPYSVARLATTAREAGNPYRTGSRSEFDAGLDAKIALTSDIILDLTINPDFGQVEADPAEINLTTFETFFPERRPFFLEGKTIFEFEIDEDRLFYSRRIGAPPHYNPPTTGFKELPQATRILGAGKLSGKTPHGFSFGAIYGLTDKEEARLTEAGVERRVVVEPATHYVVARAQQDFAKGNTIIGGMLTGGQRQLGNTPPPNLAEQSLAAGIDFAHFWANRAWFVEGRLLASRIEGTPEAITALSRHPVHNYQRPDADHLNLDPGAEALSGWGGGFAFGKGSGGKWRFETATNWRSPGLDFNDLGFLSVADLLAQETEVSYLDTEPRSFHRRIEAEFTHRAKFDFSGEHLGDEIEATAGVRLQNQWFVLGELSHETELLDTRVLRGGPALRTPGHTRLGTQIRSDNTRNYQYFLEADTWRGSDGESRGFEIEPGFWVRALKVLNVEGTFSYESNRQDFQFARRVAVADDFRYVMGRMEQETLGTSLRVEVSFTPQLSLAWFGQVLLSSGDFTDLKLVMAPRARRYEDRFARSDAAPTYDQVTRTYNATFAGETLTFSNPDFDVRTLQSNLVLRWEYRPGSNLYVVWTQNREHETQIPGFAAGRDFRRLFNAHPDNTFLVKLSYWFSL
jgi:hypothetical protein